ncbi:MAG: hypothetical protein GX660_21945 [Clostridiaceae bacterium]|nr:hypothetical protein [Clostridiaceae bacterium]
MYANSRIALDITLLAGAIKDGGKGLYSLIKNGIKFKGAPIVKVLLSGSDDSARIIDNVDDVSNPTISKNQIQKNYWDAIEDAQKGFGNKGTGGTVKVGDIDSLPSNAKSMFNKYDSSGWKGSVPGQTPGTAAGSKYLNRDAKLPTVDSAGNSITYKEYDVNNKLPNAGRDAERFVRGSDGSVYYTNDHYDTFTKIK